MATRRGTAILMTGVGKLGLIDFEIPPLGADDVHLAVASSAISPGTELRCLAGIQPNSPDFPFVPGYAQAGRVIAAGANAESWIGRRVLCTGMRSESLVCQWGGHVSDSVVAASRLIPIPDAVSFDDAAMSKMAAIAHRGWRISKPLSRDKVVVVGLGLIGQFSARVFRAYGHQIWAMDVAGHRVQVAASAGVNGVVPKGDLADSIRTVTEGGADIIVDATGVPSVLVQLFNGFRPVPWGEWDSGRKMIVQGSYPHDAAFDYQTAFSYETQVLFPRDNAASDFMAVLDLMAAGTLTTNGLISGISGPEEAQTAYEALRDQKDRVLGHVFRWRSN